MLTHIQGCSGSERIEDLFKIGQTEELALVGNLASAVMLTAKDISVKSVVKGYQHWPNWLQIRQNLKIDKNPFKADLVSLSLCSFLQTSLLRQAIPARGRNICRLQRERSLSSSSSLFCFFCGGTSNNVLNLMDSKKES